MSSIGTRVLSQIAQVCPDHLHRDIAGDIGMTPDAFSRALNDKRQFSSLELVRLAERLGADLHWLITGSPDPARLTVAARHDFDHSTGRRDVPGREGDEDTIQNIALAYRQAYRVPHVLGPLPSDPFKAREMLGTDFVRPFAERLEQALQVDVVRVSELSTAYSLSIGGRRVIAIPATGNWFRENWSIAHELGHLALEHHDDGVGAAVSEQHEAAANQFAAELLLPAETLQDIEWDSLRDADLAALIWRWGISTDALARRLNALKGHVPARVQYWAQYPTQRLLRFCFAVDLDIDEITQRMDAASQRRFPLTLQEAHLKEIAGGGLGKGTLAWMLAIDAQSLEVDAPDVNEAEVDDLAESLGL